MKVKYYPVRYTGQELLAIFPEAKKIIPEKLKEWEAKERRIEKEINYLLIKTMKKSPKDAWFVEEFVKAFHMPDFLECQKQIRRLKMLAKVARGKPQANWENFQEKIERARDYPISEIAAQVMPIKILGKTAVILCPFHNEKTPSCHLYIESNTFKCYGCQKFGDVISLTQQLFGVDFHDAVELLAK